MSINSQIQAAVVRTDLIICAAAKWAMIIAAAVIVVCAIFARPRPPGLIRIGFGAQNANNITDRP